MEIFAGEGAALWYLLLGSLVAVAGTVRLLLARDLLARLVAMNVVGIGSLLVLLSLGDRAEGAAPDPVLSALVITGLVITVAFTGLGAVLIRRIEGIHDAEHAPDQAADGDQISTDQDSSSTEGGRDS